MENKIESMSRRSFLKVSGLSAFGITMGFSASVSSGASVPVKQTDRPNIIVMLVDDMGYSDIGCYGGEINTPNIDKLAKEGLRFTQFYNTARCCPTRASLMTGLYPHQTGIGGMTNDPGSKRDVEKSAYGYVGFLNRDCVTIAEAIKDSGYHTYMAGKWHLGYHKKEQ
jgi:arylsulfatase